MEHLSHIVGATLYERLKVRDVWRAQDLDPELVREHKIEERWSAWLDGHYTGGVLTSEGRVWLKERERTVWEALERAPHLDPVTVTEVGQGNEVIGLYTVHEQSALWVMNMGTAGWLLRTYRDRIERESMAWKIKHGYQGHFYIPGRVHETEIFTHREVKADEILAWGSRDGYRRFTEVRGAA